MIKLEWTDFKTFFITHSANPQYIENSEKYFLFAFYGRLEVTCELLKDPTDTTDLNDWVNNYKANANSIVPISYDLPFSAKKLAIGGAIKNLFARNTGKQFSVTTGSNDLLYTATFPWVKMIGLECIGAEIGDYAELRVYDTPAGTYSGVANALLNQFGYTLNMAKDYYTRSSPFDADVYQGMILKITYTSVSNKTIGINYLMNEVKS
jgi:hypothetical protein